MRDCEEQLSELPENFAQLPVKEAIEILAVNHAVDGTYYYECKRKHEDLRRWINAE